MNPPCDFKRQRNGPVSSICTKPYSQPCLRSFYRCTELTASFRCLAVEGETKPGLPLREAPCSSSIIFDLDREALEFLSSVHSHETSVLSFITSLTVNCTSRRPNCIGTFQCRSINEHAIPQDRSSDESGRGSRSSRLAVSRRGRCFVVCASRSLGGVKKHRTAVVFCVSVASYLLARGQIAAPICVAGPGGRCTAG